jgi:hypothetical protein
MFTIPHLPTMDLIELLKLLKVGVIKPDND